MVSLRKTAVRFRGGAGNRIAVPEASVKTEMSRVNAMTSVSSGSAASTHVRLVAQLAIQFVRSQVERAVMLARIVRGRPEWTGCKEEQSW